MATPWPVDVTQNMIAESYTEELEDNNVGEFTPEVGPALRRRRTSTSCSIISFRSHITQAERVSLINYYENTIKRVLPVSRKNPKTGLAIVCVFLERPTFVDIAPGRYIVPFKFMVIP